jgi:hypothetical protein
MINPRSEYDYGTAAIQLAFFTPKPTAPSKPDAALVLLSRKQRIFRSHSARPDRAELVKALRWVFRKYPQHFSVMR